MNEAATSVLVTGGARSGKSRFAQHLLETSDRALVYLATAQAFDDEMTDRIDRHVAARDPRRWRTLESPFGLVETLGDASDGGSAVLVDCLTLWLSNLMLRGDDLDAATDRLVSLLPRLRGPVVLVTNEVGSGIVPDTAVGRAFRDAQGRLNQAVAAACTSVVLVAAGLPLTLKPAPAPSIRL